MRQWVTEIRAIDPITGELKEYMGPNVLGINLQDAEYFCQNNGLGYCKVTDELIAEIPTKSDGTTPDWDNMTDYEKINNN